MTNRFLINSILALVIIDQLTKFVVRSFMYLGQTIPITKYFQFTYVTNTGIAFGMFKNGNLFFTVTTAIIIAVFIWWYRKNRHLFSISMAAAVVLVLSGALGNLTDRIVRGHVIDFLEFHINQHYWPAFNLADSYITIGGIILFVSVFRNDSKSSVLSSEL